MKQRSVWPVLLLTVLYHGCAGNPEVPEYLDTSVDEARVGVDENLSDTYVKMGIEYMRLGKDEVALQKLNKALGLDPRNAGAHSAIAVLYERLSQVPLAEQHYQEAVRLAPGDSSIHSNYGSFLCRHDKTEEADAHFLKALQNPLYDTPEVAYTNAGICAMRAQDWSKAESYLRKALQANANFPVALYQMGALSHKQGRYQEASGYLARYSEIAQHSAQTLWLGIQIARQLGDRRTESEYILELRSKFPDSEELRLVYGSR